MTLLSERPEARSKIQPLSLAGRVCLITGGASGLGAATARELGFAGAHVVIADLDARAAGATAGEILGAGGSALAARLDVRDRAAAETLVARVVARFGRLDVLVNNAGTDVTKRFDELSASDFDRVIDVNLRGAVILTRAALPALCEAETGHIVNICSTAAKRTWPDASAYHASKWGLLGFSHALHSELRSDGIRVTALIVGGMRTPFLLERFPDLDLGLLQDPANVAASIRFVLELPAESVVPELTVLPLRETSWP
jgi:NAD(P)-dependent dehydrogenase (short-subunit alcohol dehydrogenase family)